LDSVAVVIGQKIELRAGVTILNASYPNFKQAFIGRYLSCCHVLGCCGDTHEPAVIRRHSVSSSGAQSPAYAL